MDKSSMVKLIVQKGHKSVNLSMFSEEEKREIMQDVAEVLMRQGKTDEVLEILEYVDFKRFAEVIRPLADMCLETGDYERALMIYEKIGDKGMVEFLKANM